MAKSRERSSSMSSDSWRTIVLGTDLNCFLGTRTCDVVFAVAQDQKAAVYTEMFSMGATSHKDNNIKCLSYSALLEEIRSSWNTEIISATSPSDKMFKYASRDVRSIIESGEVLPVLAMTLLIKLKIMKMMEQDVLTEKNEILTMKILEGDSFVEKTSSDSMEKKKGKRKGKVEDKPKKNEREKGEKKEKGEKGEKGEKREKREKGEKGESCSPTVLKNASSDTWRTCLDSIVTSYKHLIITLLGFLEPELYLSLINNGVPVICILEIIDSDADKSFSNSTISHQPYVVLSKGFDVMEVKKDPSLQQILSFSKTQSSDVFRLYKEKTKLSYSNQDSFILSQIAMAGSDFLSWRKSIVVHEPSANVNITDYSLIYKRFWENIHELYESDLQVYQIEHTFHMCYFPESVREKTSISPGEFSNDCSICYIKMANFIKLVPEIVRQYLNYIRKMKLISLGSLEDVTNHFLAYKRKVDQIPQECFTIALLIHYLVEEVCKIEAEIGKFTSEENNDIIKPESLRLDKGKENIPLYMRTIFPKPQEKTLIKAKIKSCKLSRDMKYNNYRGGFEMEKSEHIYDYEHKPVLTLSPFRIHEDNNIERMFNFYGEEMSKKLLKINMNILCHTFPALLLKYKFNKQDDIKKVMDEKDLQEWSRQLKLPITKLMDVIHLLLFSTQIRNARTILENTKEPSEWSRLFPMKTKDERLREESVKIEEEEEEIRDSKASEDENEEPKMTDRKCKYSKTPQIPFIDLYGIKYCEHLVDVVLLQQIHSAHLQYPNFQWKYVPLTDSLLIYFYYSFDNYGTVTEVFDQHIPTPVCIRDFCRFVVDDNFALFNKEHEEESERVDQTIDERTDRQDLICENLEDNKTMSDKYSKESAKERENIKKKESIKEKGDRRKSSVIEDVVVPHKRIVTKCASPEEPFKFVGFDLGSRRIQLSGSSSTLSSKDGITVTVDKTSWLGETNKLSLKVYALDHLMVIHMPTKEDAEGTFNFHFSLADDSVISFSKPKRISDTVAKLNETRCYYVCNGRKKRYATAFQKPQQNIYCLLQKKDKPLITFDIPFVADGIVNPSSTPAGYFFKHFQKINDNIVREFDIKSELECSGFLEEEIVPRETYKGIQFKETPSFGSDVNEEETANNSDTYLNESSFNFFSNGVRSSSTELADTFKFCRSKKKRRKQISMNPPFQLSIEEFFLKYFGVTVKRKLPKFKIFSSILHKNEYALKIKDEVKIPLENTTKTIYFKSTFPKPRKMMKTIKSYPVFVSPTNPKRISANFEVRSSLPSGLMVVTIPGFAQSPFQIKQFYINKGPISACVANEEYRIFYNGVVLIKKHDGSFEMLCADSSTAVFETPYFKKDDSFTLIPQKRFQGKKIIGGHKRRSIFKSIYRKEEHSINGSMSHFFRKHRNLSNKEKRTKGKPFYYFIPTNEVNVSNFCIVMSNGLRTQVKINRPIITDTIRTGSEADCAEEHITFEREDGTHSLLNSKGTLITEFADGTRITSNVVFDENLVIYVDENHCMSDMDAMRDISLPNYNIPPQDGDGWQVVTIRYEYEHPCYAKVMYDEYFHDTTVEFPNKTILSSDKGEYFSLIINDKVNATITDSNIRINTKPCTMCPCESICTLNIAPLFNQEQINPDKKILELTDSHGKIFIVHYDGQCTCAEDKEMKVTEHCKHDFKELGKLFVVKRDLSGDKFWDSKLLLKYKMCSNDYTDYFVELHKKSSTSEIDCIDFKSVVKKTYFEEFLRLYQEPFLLLEKYKSKSSCARRIMYTTSRIVSVIPASENLAPFYGAIFKAIERIEAEMVDFSSILARLTDPYIHKHLENLINLQKSENRPDDFERHVQRDKPKSSRRRKKWKGDSGKTVQLKIPFENIDIQVDQNFVDDFRQAMNVYCRWYSRLFRCKCRKMERNAKCFHHDNVAHYQTVYDDQYDKPCATETKDYCKSDTKSVICEKQTLISLGSSTSTIPCTENPFTADAKPDCSLLKTITKYKVKNRHSENNKNVILCQVLKIDPLVKGKSPVRVTPISSCSQENFTKSISDDSEQNSLRGNDFDKPRQKKMRMPFTLRSLPQTGDLIQHFDGPFQSCEVYDMNEEDSSLRSDTSSKSFLNINRSNVTTMTEKNTDKLLQRKQFRKDEVKDSGKNKIRKPFQLTDKKDKISYSVSSSEIYPKIDRKLKNDTLNTRSPSRRLGKISDTVNLQDPFVIGYSLNESSPQIPNPNPQTQKLPFETATELKLRRNVKKCSPNSKLINSTSILSRFLDNSEDIASILTDLTLFERRQQ